MAYSLKFLLLLISLSFPVRSQLDKFTYSGFSDADSNITSIGVAEIEKNGMIRLTNDTRRLIGQAFYSSPVRFKLSKNGSVFSFSSSFAFSIVPEYPKLGGHGLAFVISPSKGPTGLPSQYFGLLNASDAGNFSNHLFAVEFDTVQDFEFGDINDNHVGIDVNSLHSNASAAAAYYDDDSRKHSLNLKSARTIQAWVDYDSVEKVINVTISPFSRKPRIALLSFKMDMSPIFHEFMYVGFSSSTGLLASSHYLFGWSFNVNGEAQSLDLRSLPTLPAPKKNHTALTTGVTVVSVVLFVLAILAALFMIRKIKNADLIEAWELDIGPHRFSYKELKKATKGFRDKELLGHGGFGRVYKGTLPNSKTQVAVKRISHESRQGLREFVSEIASIGRLRHRNLVQLLGWCRRRGDLLIVYDFMANRSLDKFLFEEPKSVLSWEQRFKIIKGVASGLLYLHEGYEQVVIHRDIKASNVLLDSDMNGRLGDFGLARIYEHGENPSTTRVVGTLGYLAPELSRTGKANTGSDVFSFGALLLEVVCGRKPVEPKAKLDELVLVDWVWDMWGEGRLLDVVDPRLEGVFDESQVVMVLKLGLMCSNNSPAARPGMRQVVSYLEGEAEMPEVLRVPSGFNERKGEFEGFDSSMHSRSFASSLDNGFASLTASPLSLLSGRGGSR